MSIARSEFTTLFEKFTSQRRADYMTSNGGSGALSKLDRRLLASATSDPAVAKACAAGGFLGTNATDRGWLRSGVDTNDCAMGMRDRQWQLPAFGHPTPRAVQEAAIFSLLANGILRA